MAINVLEYQPSIQILAVRVSMQGRSVLASSSWLHIVALHDALQVLHNPRRDSGGHASEEPSAGEDYGND